MKLLKFQTPKPKYQTNIEIWDFFVIWCLRFGILLFSKTFQCSWFRIYFDVTLTSAPTFVLFKNFRLAF